MSTIPLELSCKWNYVRWAILTISITPTSIQILIGKLSNDIFWNNFKVQRLKSNFSKLRDIISPKFNHHESFNFEQLNTFCIKFHSMQLKDRGHNYVRASLVPICKEIGLQRLSADDRIRCITNICRAKSFSK